MSSLEKLCNELDLSSQQCEYLGGKLSTVCRVGRAKGPKAKRARTRWQECIAKERKGKPFDPQAIRELAKEYRAGKCP